MQIYSVVVHAEADYQEAHGGIAVVDAEGEGKSARAVAGFRFLKTAAVGGDKGALGGRDLESCNGRSVFGG